MNTGPNKKNKAVKKTGYTTVKVKKNGTTKTMTKKKPTKYGKTPRF